MRSGQETLELEINLNDLLECQLPRLDRMATTARLANKKIILRTRGHFFDPNNLISEAVIKALMNKYYIAECYVNLPFWENFAYGNTKNYSLTEKPPTYTYDEVNTERSFFTDGNMWRTVGIVSGALIVSVLPFVILALTTAAFATAGIALLVPLAVIALIVIPVFLFKFSEENADTREEIQRIEATLKEPLPDDSSKKLLTAMPSIRHRSDVIPVYTPTNRAGAIGGYDPRQFGGEPSSPLSRDSNRAASDDECVRLK